MGIIQPDGNYFNKYRNNGKLINSIVNGFFQEFDSILDGIEFNKVYEAGCGEGYISNHVSDFSTKKKKEVCIKASDLSAKVINRAKLDYPNIQFSVNSIYELSEMDESYDLVLACEVLEHLEEPQKALRELFRISNRYVLISIPNEPIWRIANFMRGKYIGSLGNTPGHINHWKRKEIISIVSEYGNILEVMRPFPWTMILAEKNDNNI